MRQEQRKVWVGVQLLELNRCVKPGQPVVHSLALGRGLWEIAGRLEGQVHVLAYLTNCKLPGVKTHFDHSHSPREGDHVHRCQYQRVVTPL